MKDLKHLIYFEKLLENSSNELIDQARADGKLAIGYTCFHMPEVLLNLDNCFSVRLRAPKTGSMDIATYYSPTTPANTAAPCWSGVLRAASTTWTPWRGWTPVRR